MGVLVVLSPHLDDAVLSCGGRIARAIDAGRRVVVATVFTRDEPIEPPTPLAADLRRWWRLPPGEVMAHRREEDLEACRRLGAEARHLGLPEAPYRIGSDGRPLYPSLESLFSPLAHAEASGSGEVDAALDLLLAGLGAECEVFGPLGVGHHVDHQLVRAALLARSAPLALYEEFPYTEWKWFAARRALRGLPERDRFVADTLPLDADLLDRRRHAITAYASQVPALFRTEARLAKQLRRAARRSGGERVWRRR